MKNHSNPTTQLGLLATGAAALTGSADGAITLFDNGGSGWTFSGSINETTVPSSTFITSLDALGILPAGLLDLSFEARSGTFVKSTYGTLVAVGEGDGEPSPDSDYTSVVGTSAFVGAIVGGGTTYTRMDLYNITRQATLVGGLGFQNIADEYLVFALYDQANEDDTDNSDVYLGWVELEASITPVTGNDPWSLRIKRIGIEDQANKSIVVGAIPEASSTALLLLGAAGAAARRRRKTA
jgi:hypothetical protein